MNIKSLLLGSAAALVAVSGARAADAIVAAEPEPVEYVRVCDAFGTGYFYIPGTETCLRIGGYVRVQNFANSVDVSNQAAFNAAAILAGLPVRAGVDASRVAQTTRAQLTVSAKSDSEYGMLEGFMALQSNTTTSGAAGNFVMDQAYIQLGGLTMGYFTHWNDRGLAGETDTITGAVTKFNSIRYEMNTGALRYGVAIDQQNAAWAGDSNQFGNTDGIGVSGIIGGSFGAVTADLVGYYDTDADEGGVVFLASAAMGPGTLGVQASYNSDASAYMAAHNAGVLFIGAAAANVLFTEWYVGADYTFKATDKLTLGVAGQYQHFETAGAVQADAGDQWTIGATADYAITDGLAFKATVNYEVYEGPATAGNLKREAVFGYVRLQRSF